MSQPSTAKIGKRGTLVIPAEFRKRLGLEDDSIVAIEEHDGGILIRPVAILPVEIYTPERQAEFLLSNAVDEADYAAAREEVRQLGLDPDAIEHASPITTH